MKNLYTLGNIALSCSGSHCSCSYNVSSHGCPSATYDSMINADLPQYTRAFYSPTRHESISEIIYKKTEINYDAGLREIQRVLEGMPLEVYIPKHSFADDGGSAIPKTGKDVDLIQKKEDRNAEIIKEIINAQKEVVKREIILREEVKIEEVLIMKRKLTKRVTVMKLIR